MPDSNPSVADHPHASTTNSQNPNAALVTYLAMGVFVIMGILYVGMIVHASRHWLAEIGFRRVRTIEDVEGYEI
jgi:F0F1-type ATP synthase membrane subunit a